MWGWRGLCSPLSDPMGDPKAGKDTDVLQGAFRKMEDPAMCAYVCTHIQNMSGME